MPELPDVTVYVEALERHVGGKRLDRVRILTPFVLRSFDPPVEAVTGRTVQGFRRIGKRIVLDMGVIPAPPVIPAKAGIQSQNLFIVIHLMIAGRFRWNVGQPLRLSKIALAVFEFSTGDLVLTEAGSKRRASIQLIRGEEALKNIDPGGLEVLDLPLDAFRAALTRERHTLKRTLTDPHVFSGIGNSYSDEILHRARLSPVQLTTNLDDEEIERLWRATRDTLALWTERLRDETGEGFPEKVTAFRDGMAVHGRYGKPCPDCGTPVQHIVYADNETNYCARCQTGGKLLADRALSRLLHGDWPKSIDEL
jgi:formamidopyrimidine-DNA glycosylase